MGLEHNFAYTKGLRGAGIRDGADVERAILGAPRVDKSATSGYVPFEEAVELIKSGQPDALKRSSIVNKLRKQISELATRTDIPVKFFTAVGTPLDIFHGVDAFFEQGSARVTLDVSMCEKETTKADVLIVAALDQEGNVLVRDQEIQEAAKNIARLLNERAVGPLH